MKDGAVYLRDLADAEPEPTSTPAPLARGRVSAKTLPPPPAVPVVTSSIATKPLTAEQARAILGERWVELLGKGAKLAERGALEFRAKQGWYARFSVLIDGELKRPRFALGTRHRGAARALLDALEGHLFLKPREVSEGPIFTREDYPGEYTSWKFARRRCLNEADQNWKYYGGRGIRLHDAWASPTGFQAFMQDMGPKPTRAHVLGREDKNGHIVPGNAVWMLRSDVRVGVRKNYDTGLTSKRCMQLVARPGREQREVIASERNMLIRIEGVDGGLTPDEADELARHLICVADAMRRRRSVYDAAR